MITKNGKNALLGSPMGNNVDLKSANGANIVFNGRTAMNCLLSNDSLTIFDNNKIGTQKWTIALGSGTTKETENDYWLESIITKLTNNSLSFTNKIASDNTFGNDSFTFVTTYTNNTSENVVVGEIGILFNTSGSNIMYYSNPSDTTILLYRKTFEPITLAPNESKTFAINLM